jgi:hypothetical protein
MLKINIYIKKYIHVAKKISHYLKIKIALRSKRLSPGVYVVNNIDKCPESIGFDLSNGTYVHIGDNIFFEPILRGFVLAGYTVYVAPTSAMEEYYTEAGYKVVDAGVARGKDFVITSIWMYCSFLKDIRKSVHICLDTADHGMSLPVSDHIRTSLLAKIGVDLNAIPSYVLPYRVNGLTELLNNIKGNIYVYNDEIDSGFFRVSNNHYQRLVKSAKVKTQEGFTIVRLGVRPNRNIADESLPFCHIDLRGMTDIIELFKIFNSPQVVGSISFDTAIAHIAILYKKNALVCMRKFSNSHTYHVKKNIFPSYKTLADIHIDYI